MRLTEKRKKGQVEFKQPPAQLVADIPGDEEMRENLDEMKRNDGHPDSCGIIQEDPKD